MTTVAIGCCWWPLDCHPCCCYLQRAIGFESGFACTVNCRACHCCYNRSTTIATTSSGVHGDDCGRVETTTSRSTSRAIGHSRSCGTSWTTRGHCTRHCGSRVWPTSRRSHCNVYCYHCSTMVGRTKRTGIETSRPRPRPPFGRTRSGNSRPRTNPDSRVDSSMGSWTGSSHHLALNCHRSDSESDATRTNWTRTRSSSVQRRPLTPPPTPSPDNRPDRMTTSSSRLRSLVCLTPSCGHSISNEVESCVTRSILVLPGLS